MAEARHYAKEGVKNHETSWHTKLHGFKISHLRSGTTLLLAWSILDRLAAAIRCGSVQRTAFTYIDQTLHISSSPGGCFRMIPLYSGPPQHWWSHSRRWYAGFWSGRPGILASPPRSAPWRCPDFQWWLWIFFSKQNNWLVLPTLHRRLLL